MGPPLFEIPATIQATAHIPIRQAVILNAVTATFEISVTLSLVETDLSLPKVPIFFMMVTFKVICKLARVGPEVRFFSYKSKPGRNFIAGIYLIFLR